MDDTAKEIQMESAQQSENSNTAKAIVSNKSLSKKTSVFCFKKRKKSSQMVMETDEMRDSDSLKDANEATNATQNEAGVLNPGWTTGRAWMALKRLVTLRSRSKMALKKQAQGNSHLQLEANTDDSSQSRFPKEQTSSGIKLSCLSFSRSKKKASQAETTEELDHGEKGNETTSILNSGAKRESENVVLEDSQSSTLSSSRTAEDKGGDNGIEKSIGDKVTFYGESVFPAELRPDTDQLFADCAIQSEILRSENVLETEHEKQIFQLHHGSLYGNPDNMESKRIDIEVEIGPPCPQILPESEHDDLGVQANHIHPQEAVFKESGRSLKAVPDGDHAKEVNSIEVLLHGSPSAFEDEALSPPESSEEEVSCEANKLTGGMGIIITITEAEECLDEEEPSYISDHFPFAHTTKPKGNKQSQTRGSDRKRDSKTCAQVPLAFGGNDQEQPISEQYEGLLIETAASLVKAAIQSSIEQVVNEMALEQNKQNSFL